MSASRGDHRFAPVVSLRYGTLSLRRYSLCRILVRLCGLALLWVWFDSDGLSPRFSRLSGEGRLLSWVVVRRRSWRTPSRRGFGRRAVSRSVGGTELEVGLDGVEPSSWICSVDLGGEPIPLPPGAKMRGGAAGLPARSVFRRGGAGCRKSQRRSRRFAGWAFAVDAARTLAVRRRRPDHREVVSRSWWSR